MLRIEISKIRSAIWRKDNTNPLLKEIDKLDAQGIHPNQEIKVPKELFMKLSEIQPVPFVLQVKEWEHVSRTINKEDFQHPLVRLINDEIREVRKHKRKEITIYLNQKQINTVEEYL